VDTAGRCTQLEDVSCFAQAIASEPDLRLVLVAGEKNLRGLQAALQSLRRQLRIKVENLNGHA
jgi:hypothetical protein